MTSIQRNLSLSSFTLACLSASLLMGCGEVVVGDSDAGSGNPADAPTIVDITPNRASLKGITEITITGTGFSGETQVILGGARATDITVEGDDTLRFVAPASTVANEALDVRVFNESGFALAAESITYNTAPVLSTVRPPVLRLAGGDTVTITGEHFEENSTGTPVVTIGGVEATEVEIVDDNTITAVSAPGAGADVAVRLDVAVETDNGDMVAEEAQVYIGKGLFFGTSRGTEVPTGLHFFDPPTQRTVLVLPLDGSVSRFVREASGTILTRFGNQGTAAFGASVFGRVDLATGTVPPLVAFKNAGTNDVIRTRGITNLGPNVFAVSSNGQFGRLNPLTEEFTSIVSPGGDNRSSCLVPGPTPTTVIMVGEFDEPMRLIDTQLATVTDLATLSGDILPGTEVRCHGGTLQDGTFFAIQYDRNSRETNLVRINQQTGLVTFVADLPEAATGLIATETGL